YRSWFRLVFGILVLESFLETPSWCMSRQAETKAALIREDFFTGPFLNEERICSENAATPNTNYLLSGVVLVNPIWSSLYEIFVVLFILRKAFWRCKYLSFFFDIEVENEEKPTAFLLTTG
ncbi:unnamed protein product, partial [Amoebophrya sp. A120]